jgi:hypothetical protein
MRQGRPVPVPKGEQKRCVRCRWWFGDTQGVVEAACCLCEDVARTVNTEGHAAWMPQRDFGCRYWEPLEDVEGFSDPLLAGKYLDDAFANDVALGMRKQWEAIQKKRIPKRPGKP